MARFGLSALRSLLRGQGSGRSAGSSWQAPAASWSRPFGLGWERPYTVRYASNLDDGPNHGAPLGASVPAASAEAPTAASTSGTSTAASTGSAPCPTASSPCLRAMGSTAAPTPWR